MGIQSNNGFQELSRVAKNARLGDGLLKVANSSRNAYLSFVSTDLSLLRMKKSMCLLEGIYASDISTQSSGYGGTKTIYKFRTRVHPRLTHVHDIPTIDLIKTLDKVDLFLWYMDDGSWHKSRNTMHLYCNMLKDDEAAILISQIESLYGIAPTLRKDRKRDGREFNYLYFPRKLVQKFRPDFKWFVMGIGIESMFYKFGGLDYFDPEEE